MGSKKIQITLKSDTYDVLKVYYEKKKYSDTMAFNEWIESVLNDFAAGITKFDNLDDKLSKKLKELFGDSDISEALKKFEKDNLDKKIN